MNTQNLKAGMEGFVTLHIPCRYSYLRIVRQSVSDICVHAGLSEFKAGQLEMAVDEACSGIIEQALRDAKDDNEMLRHGLRVNLIQEKDRVIVELYVQGQGLDLDQQDVVDPADYADHPDRGGLRAYVIRRFVDGLEYEPGGRSGHCLSLVKTL